MPRLDVPVDPARLRPDVLPLPVRPDPVLCGTDPLTGADPVPSVDPVRPDAA
jgi:hypothetical protein